MLEVSNFFLSFFLFFLLPALVNRAEDRGRQTTIDLLLTSGRTVAWPCGSRNNAGEAGLCGIYNHQDVVGKGRWRKKGL